MSSEEHKSDLANPAKRALAGAGYTRLDEFTKVSEAEVMKLHGMGSKAMGRIRRALAERGKSFAEEERR